MSRELSKCVLLLTGATEPNGRAIAQALAAKGCRLALVSSNAADLDLLAAMLKPIASQVVPFPVDLHDPAQRQPLVEAVLQSFGQLDFLINAATVAPRGRFEEATPERLREVTEWNFFVPVELMRYVQPALLQSTMTGQKPAIVNLLSVRGRVAEGGFAEQSASEHALLGFCEAIRAEYARFDIDVLQVLAGVEPEVKPELVADGVLKALQSRSRETVVGRAAWWAALGQRFWPGLLRRRTIRAASS